MNPTPALPIPIPIPNTDLDELSHTKRPRPEDDDGDRDRDRSRRRLSLPGVIPGNNALYVERSTPAYQFRPSSAPSALEAHLRSRAHLRPHFHTPPRRRPGQRMDVDPAAPAPAPPPPPETYIPSMDPATALTNIHWIASLAPPDAAAIPQADMAAALIGLLSALPPIDQQVLSVHLLGGRTVDSLTTEEMYLLARELAELRTINGQLTF